MSISAQHLLRPSNQRSFSNSLYLDNSRTARATRIHSSRSSNKMGASAGIPPREDLDKYLSVALDAAKEAGKVIVAAWDQPRKIEHKGEYI